MRALVLATLLFSLPAAAKVHQVEVYDADTITIPASGMITGFRIRILGLDGPELRSSCPAERALATRARSRLVALASAGLDVQSGLELDLYGRVLATVRTPNGQDVASVLIAEGLARPFDGKTARRPWCDEAGRVVP